MSFAALLGVSSLAAGAGAAPPGSLPIDLDWEGPPSCPASDDIDRDVRLVLGDAKLPESLPPIVARVAVRETTDGRFEVRMRTTSGGEQRERALRTETCGEARDLVAFLLALLIDPRREPSRSPASEPPAPAKTPGAAPDRAPAPHRWRETERVHFIVGLSGNAELGILPGGSVGGEVRAGLLFSGWSMEARAGAWLPRHAESPDVSGAGGEFSLFEAGLVGCLRGAPWEGPVLQGCVGPVLFGLQGEGYGVRAPGRETALFAGVDGEAALLIAISPKLSLRPALGALVPFRRPTFAIHDVGTIHRPSVVTARASLGFEARF